MGQRNISYTSPMNDSEIEHAHLHPEPCVTPYGQIVSFPQAGNSHGPLPSGITFMAAPSAARAVPVLIGHGMHNQIVFHNHQIINGFHGSFKGKTAEGFPVNFQYFYPALGSSSFVVPDYNVFPVFIGYGHHRGARNRGAGVIDHNPGLQFMPTSHGGQLLQVMSAPWLDNAPGIPFMIGYAHGYQAITANRNLVTFVHFPVRPHPLPPSMPLLRGSVDFHPPVIGPPQNMVELVPRFVRPAPPALGVRVYQPHHPEQLTFESTSRHHDFPHFRVLPEDGVAMLDVSNSGRRIDHHRDMRLDIDHMTYEELLALGEHIGSAGSGLSENFILGHLKTRTFTSSNASSHTGEGSSTNQEPTFCTICQMDYDDEEKVGTLDCSHEYHVDCINKWLAVKNSCPVCKGTALTAQGNES